MYSVFLMTLPPIIRAVLVSIPTCTDVLVRPGLCLHWSLVSKDLPSLKTPYRVFASLSFFLLMSALGKVVCPEHGSLHRTLLMGSSPTWVLSILSSNRSSVITPTADPLNSRGLTPYSSVPLCTL